MYEIVGKWAAGDTSSARADELFLGHRQQIFRDTDELIAKLMVLQWLAAIAIAFLLSPRTWQGESSQIHIHVWAAIFLGGAITVFPVWMTLAWPGAAATRYILATAQMLMSALIIGLTGGRIETHFHVFGSLVILSLYRDWRVLIPATIVVGLDHFVRGIYWPYSVYGVLTASPWRSVEHAGWVVFEDIFLVISCLRSVSEMRFIANRTAALEVSEQRSRAIFEKAPIGMALVGLDEHYLQANTSFCEMMDYSEEELRTRTPFQITHEEDLGSTMHVTGELLSGAARSSAEKRYIRKNGDLLWAFRTACLIRDEAGKPLHFLTMVEDITQRKTAEIALQAAKDEAERANNAKSEFLSRMSHELRTPLNAILGFGQLLERQDPTEKQRSGLSYILSAGRHLLEMINEVLDISRIETGDLEISLQPVSVDDALQEVLDLMRPLAEEREIKLSAPSPADPATHVLADKRKLRQVILNLLANAVKYTPRGGQATLSCSARGDRVRIGVTDNGKGIAADKFSRLFTPFDRLDVENSEVQGTGLGLALCQRLMTIMRGSVGVESVPGCGSTFWIELISAGLEPVNVSEIKMAGEAGEELSATVTNSTLLYIEDNHSNVSLMQAILSDRPGIKLIPALRGQLGIDLARQLLPDLVLLDVHLPDLSGWEVLAHLKANEATRHIPVVVLSADATTRQIKRFIDAGAADFLTKPLDVAQFLGVVQRATSGSHECVAA